MAQATITHALRPGSPADIIIQGSSAFPPSSRKRGRHNTDVYRIVGDAAKLDFRAVTGEGRLLLDALGIAEGLKEERITALTAVCAAEVAEIDAADDLANAAALGGAGGGAEGAGSGGTGGALLAAAAHTGAGGAIAGAPAIAHPPSAPVSSQLLQGAPNETAITAMVAMASTLAKTVETLTKMVEEKAAPAQAPKNEKGKPQATYTKEALIDRVWKGDSAVAIPGTWGEAATGAPLTDVAPTRTITPTPSALLAQVALSRYTNRPLPATGTPLAPTGSFGFGTQGFSRIAAHGGGIAHGMATAQEGGTAGAAGRRTINVLNRAILGDASMVGTLIEIAAADPSYCIDVSYFDERNAGLALAKHTTMRMDETPLSRYVQAGFRAIRLMHAYADVLSTDGRRTAETTLSPEFIGDMQALEATFAYDRARDGQPPLSSSESLVLITRVIRAVIEDELQPYRRDVEDDCSAAIARPSSVAMTFIVPEPGTHDYLVTSRVKSIFNTASMPIVKAAAGAGNAAAEASAAARDALTVAAALDKTTRARSSTAAAAARLVAAGEGGGRGAGLAAPAPATASLTPTALFGRATRVALTSLCQPEGGPLRKYLQGGGEFCVRNLLNLACALPEGGLCQRQHLQKEVPPGASTSPWESARRGLVTLN